ncbi:DUF305 domain-containing protein [Nonomuraea typhae]|uniref:DUF305 domain-containing protein n=1 Tax=Nonomuraea typhae TaxID=2603600 RepID=UPI0012F9F1B7|nr:DUF305 domain-containing protein [Nonomuraea typhae]
MKRAFALGLLLLAAACAAPETAPPVNSEDVMFLQMMIPHHQQGIEIVKQARGKTVPDQLKTLAAAIETTQGDEVKKMMGWLRSWDQPTVAPTSAHAGHGGMPETDREKIGRLARSKDFPRDFLNLLIAHQDDAVQMARIETMNGINPEVKAWADQVGKSREAQIDQMMSLLKTA